VKNPLIRLGWWYQRLIAGPFRDGRCLYEAHRQTVALEEYLRGHPEVRLPAAAEGPGMPHLH
jgi:hypothetical protein